MNGEGDNELAERLRMLQWRLKYDDEKVHTTCYKGSAMHM